MESGGETPYCQGYGHLFDPIQLYFFLAKHWEIHRVYRVIGSYTYVHQFQS